MDDYNKVLELNPDNALTYYNRAILNTEIGKTAEAVANLALLYRRLGTDHGFCQSVRLLKTYERLRRYRAVWLVAALFAVLKRPLRSHFVAGNAITVAQFNFYKLGLLIGCLRKG